ncbi:MAG: glycosyltransferase family 2 protein [Deltaproteobacteria bacterium]|nr:glycosyltransferase family 2 protein [Deltaproteobacteria bacterium]
MSKGHFISVVLPIFNEEDAIPQLLQRLRDVLQRLPGKFEIIAVDDGSRDGSLELLQKAKENFSQLAIVQLARNYGQTAALAAGIDHAQGDIVITMDADLQHDPGDIERFIEVLDEGYDVVSGWREVRTDSYASRRLPSLIANFFMRWMSGIPIRDFGSTFKGYKAQLLKEIDLFGELHRFIPVLAHRLGARMKEIPITVHPREKGSSKYGLGRIFGVFEDLVFLEFYSNHLTKPIRGFGRLFILFFAIGFFISLCLMVIWCLGIIDRVLDHGAMLLFSVFLMIVGVQFLVTGILAELLSRIYLQTGNRKIYSVREVHKAEA